MSQSRSEALRSARANSHLESASNAKVHTVAAVTGGSHEICSDQIPALPVLHFTACSSCAFSITSGTCVVKVLVEGCNNFNLHLDNCSVTTAVIEVWNCRNCKITIGCNIGTVQADLCSELHLDYVEARFFGSVVQAGVHDLHVSFSDGSQPPVHSGLEQLRLQHPGVEINDTTDQFISRIVSGQLLTEQILRLANEFPTTAREKAAFEEESQRKAAALQGMVSEMMGTSLTAEEKDELLRKAGSIQSPGECDGAAARGAHRKKLGNEAFKAGDFTQAAVHYTESIQVFDSDPMVFSNRAACFLKLGRHQQALDDSCRSVALDPAMVKAHFRKGTALYALARYEESAQTMAHVLKLDPSNKDAEAGLRLAQVKLRQRQ